MADLSILIPSRNEMFLARTIQDILEHIEADTEVIAVLDGQWADPPVPDDPRVTLVYHPEPIGQRAATNEAAGIATGRYVMKCDAHCAFAQGFDRVMLEDMQDDWTMVPVMKNLHAFDWVCPDGHRRYQGPSGPCRECGKPTEMDIVWISKRSPNSTSYCFDTTLHFQYFGQFKHRPEGKGDLTETMSLQGSCWMLTREKYFDLNISDESWGIWGQQGVEVAVKTWLSGGRVVVNHRTFYSHMFRTSGGDFGFPYPLSGKQVHHARKKSQDLFLNNKWDKQIYPLSWLIEKFKPVPYWHDESGEKALARILESGATFSNLHPELFGVLGIGGSIPSSMADHTSAVSVDRSGEKVSVLTMGSSKLSSSSAIPDKDIPFVADKKQMEGITTSVVIANMVKNRASSSATLLGYGASIKNVDKPVNAVQDSINTDLSVSVRSNSSSPNPATSARVDNNSGKEPLKLSFSNIGECEIIGDDHSMPPSQVSSRFEADRVTAQSASPIITRCIVYYTDNRLNPIIMQACQDQLREAKGDIPLISVVPEDVDGEPGILTMHKQVLAGLQASDADVIFLAEHDILYHPSHFDFIPKRKDVFYYNANVWRWKYPTGPAVWTDGLQQLSGLVAYRELLIDYFTRKIAQIESGKFDRHFEPGTKGSCYGYHKGGKYGSENYLSEFPNVDIRHDRNQTKSKWSPEEFRNKKYACGWKETDEIPYWGVISELFKVIA